jgi:hypothetical protein
MAKTPHNSMRNKKEPKSVVGYQGLKTLLSWRDKNPGEVFIKQLSEHLIEWSLEESSEDFLDFLRLYTIPSTTYYEMLPRFPILKAAHEYAKDQLGSRRLKMAVHRDKNCNERSIHYDLRRYHHSWMDTWKEDEEAKKKLDAFIEQKVEVLMKTYHDKTDTSGSLPTP